MTPDDLLTALLHGPTESEQRAHAVGFASYRAFLAGVEWGARYGRGEFDDAERAWADWFDRSQEGC